MVDRGCEARLPQEALAEDGVARELGRDQLQGDGPIERELGCPVDDAHASAAENAVDAVARELGSEIR
jgi:hypothetical protein